MNMLLVSGLSVVLAFITLNVPIATAGWEFGGVEAGEIEKFFLIDNALFACSDGGLFRSVDTGRTWSRVNDARAFMSTRSVRKIDGKLFVCGNSGVFSSTDNGTTWDSSTTAANNIKRAVDICKHKGTLFLVTEGAGVYRSTNGTVWSKIAENIQQYNFTSIISTGTTLIAGSERHGYRCTDNGVTWEVAFDYPVFDLIMDGDSIVAAAGPGVQKVSLDGSKWRALGLQNVRQVCLDSQHFLYAACSLTIGLFKSTDNGGDWTSIKQTIPSSTFTAVAVVGDTLLCSPYQLGIYRSADKGASWTHSTTGMTDVQVFEMAYASGVVYAGCEYNGLARSTDQGATWTRQFGNARVVHVAARDRRVLVGTGTPGVLSYSQDSGKYYEREVELDNQYAFIEGCYLDKNDMYYASGRSLARSSDNGVTWEGAHEGMPDAYVNCMAFTDNAIFSGTNSSYHNNYAGTFKSVDNGLSWTQLNTGLSATDDVWSMVAVDNVVLIGTVRGVKRSTDLGETWTSCLGGNTVSMCTMGNTIYALNEFSVSFSTDHGVTWTVIEEKIADGLFSSVAASDQYLFVGLNAGGVARLKIDWLPVSVNEGRVERGEGREGNGNLLTQNAQRNSIELYPNPIQFGVVRIVVPEDVVDAQLIVSNSIGQQVHISSGVQSVNGSVQLETSMLSPGIYNVIVQDHANSFSGVLVVLR